MNKSFVVAVLVVLAAVSVFVAKQASHAYTSKPDAQAPSIRSAPTHEQTARRQSARSESPTVASGPSDPESSRYEKASDLSSLVDSMRQDAMAQKPAALRAVAFAREECMSLSASQLVLDQHRYAADTAPTATEQMAMLGHLKSFEARCANLARQEQIRLADVRSQTDKAASLGDSVAFARDLSRRRIVLSKHEFDEAVRQILRSRDPYAISEIAGLSQEVADDQGGPFGEFSGSTYAYYAWLLVSCDLGRDCGANSTLVRNLCLGGGICGPGSLRDVVSKKVFSPVDFERVSMLEREVLRSHFQ